MSLNQTALTLQSNDVWFDLHKNNADGYIMLQVNNHIMKTASFNARAVPIICV